MEKYLLSIYQPDGDPPSPEILSPVMDNLAALRKEMVAAGVWVFSAGLHPPDAATVLRPRDGELLTTDGPYVEGKEHLGGFTVIRVPDRATALAWGGKLAQAIGLLPIEVRPLHDDAEDCG